MIDVAAIPCAAEVNLEVRAAIEVVLEAAFAALSL
jgi:hypothetical protein